MIFWNGWRNRGPSYPAHAGYPVRRGLSVPSLASLEYWVARSSRAMTAGSVALSRIQLSNSQTHSVVGRHCEGNEAIHSQSNGDNGLLRRFAPRNDVAI